MMLIDLEFKTIIKDYFEVIKFKEISTHVILPFIISGILTLILNENEIHELYLPFLKEALSVLAILTGFNIASLTIILSSSSKTIEEMKVFKTRRIIDKKIISLYKLFLIFLIYTIVFSVFLILFFLIQLILHVKSAQISLLLRIFLFFNIWFLLSVVILTLFDISYIYFSFWRGDKDTYNQKL